MKESNKSGLSCWLTNKNPKELEGLDDELIMLVIGCPSNLFQADDAEWSNWLVHLEILGGTGPIPEREII